MLVHLRLVVPTDLRARVQDLLVGDERVTNVTLVPGASLDPDGDLIEADVAREAADEVLGRLQELGLSHRGSVSISLPDATPFDKADEVDRAAEGDPDDGVLWQVVLSQAEEAASGSRSFHLFLILATALAAVAVLTDSPVLVVGAMVVGPDFGPVGAVCTGVVLREWKLVVRASLLLLRGYLTAIAVVAISALIGRLAGAVTADQVAAARPLTSFIYKPDLWSAVVSVIAGMVGALALSAEKSTTLVGVFIAVTTVPAAGNLAVAIATGVGSEVTGSLVQLAVNIVGLLVGGIFTLWLQRISRKGPVDASALHT